MQPRVSFVVPCYNYGRFVAQAVDSLLSQTFEAIEVIVIDDASSDDTAAVLDRYADESRVRVVRHTTNAGHIRTYNEGLALARGEFVGILSADDYCQEPDAVARQVALFDAHQGLGLVFSAYVFVDQQGAVGWVQRPSPADYVRGGLEEFESLLHENYVPASGTLARRRCHDELGVYDSRLPHSADWDLWLRIAARYDVAYIATPLYAYRVHGANMSIAGISPGRANADLALMLQRAFDALPPDASLRLRKKCRAVMQRALLRTCVVDCAQGRPRRGWAGLVDAVWRSPALVAVPQFYGVLARLLMLTVLGHRRYLGVLARLQTLKPARRLAHSAGAAG
jgi:glycosyltransferase involved in cell wall biosynthesis